MNTRTKYLFRKGDEIIFISINSFFKDFLSDLARKFGLNNKSI